MSERTTFLTHEIDRRGHGHRRRKWGYLATAGIGVKGYYEPIRKRGLSP